MIPITFKKLIMKNYLNFNRHEEMDGSTRDSILNLIGNPKFYSIKNYLYGLYDGYFYNEKLNEMANDKSLTINEKFDILKLIETISNYKSLN